MSSALVQAYGAPVLSAPGYRRVIAATAVGTIFEWYDFFLCTILAPVFATVFFPPGNEAAGFLSAFTAYAIGFIVRPLGALIFGPLGDKLGRKYIFLITIIFMGFGTFTIGLLPTFAQAGWIAPALLIVVRVLQGIALGGEYSGAIIYISEYVEANRRGFATSFVQVTPSLGFLLAFAVIKYCEGSMTPDAFLVVGWRIPFLLSILLLILTVYLRTTLRETPVFIRLKNERRISSRPLRESLFMSPNRRDILLALFGASIGQGAVVYTSQFYVLFFLTNTLQLAPSITSAIFLCGTGLGVATIMFSAWLSDRVGRLRIVMCALLVASITFVPAFKALARAVNPELIAFQARTPVTIITDRKGCHTHIVASPWTKFSTCDTVRDLAAKAGLSFTVEDAPGDSSFGVQIGNSTFEILSDEKVPVSVQFQKILFSAGYPGLEWKHVGSQAQIDAGGNPVFEKTGADPAKIDFVMVAIAIFIIVATASAAYGPSATFFVEYFPARLRYTSVSVVNNIGNGWFGGVVPIVAATAVTATGNIYAGLWYTVAACGISFVIGTLFLGDKARQGLD